MKLTIELVPKTCWYSNVRSEVTRSEWNKIRAIVLGAAAHKCEICGGTGRKGRLDCHEVWLYDEAALTQTLDRMIALCPACHQVKHIGLAIHRKRLPQALTHLAKVNSMEVEEAEEYIAEQFDVWARRSRHKWKLDITRLAQYK